MLQKFETLFPSFLIFIKKASITLTDNSEETIRSLTGLSARAHLANDGGNVGNGNGNAHLRYFTCLDCYEIDSNGRLKKVTEFMRIIFNTYVINHGCALVNPDKTATLWINFPDEEPSAIELIKALLATITNSGIKGLFRSLTPMKEALKFQKSEHGKTCAHILNVATMPGKHGAIKDLLAPFLQFCDEQGWTVALDEYFDGNEDGQRILEIYESLGFETVSFYKSIKGLPPESFRYMIREPKK